MSTPPKANRPQLLPHSRCLWGPRDNAALLPQRLKVPHEHPAAGPSSADLRPEGGRVRWSVGSCQHELLGGPKPVAFDLCASGGPQASPEGTSSHPALRKARDTHVSRFPGADSERSSRRLPSNGFPKERFRIMVFTKI